MPESETKSETKQVSEVKREPRALSTEYHKARKQLLLWAGILFIWELVGVDLDKAKEAGGNIGAIIGAIKSPQAVPWALLILVAYFLFKVTVEWHQCNAARRQMSVAKIDYRSSWIVALLACGLYVWQTISHIQLANAVNADKIGSGIGGFVISSLLSLGIIFALSHIADWQKHGIVWKDLGAIALAFVLLLGFGAVMLGRTFLTSLHWAAAGVGLAIGLGVMFVIVMRGRA